MSTVSLYIEQASYQCKSTVFRFNMFDTFLKRYIIKGTLGYHGDLSVCITSSCLCKVVSRDFTQATRSDTNRRINVQT